MKIEISFFDAGEQNYTSRSSHKERCNNDIYDDSISCIVRLVLVACICVRVTARVAFAASGRSRCGLVNHCVLRDRLDCPF